MLRRTAIALVLALLVALPATAQDYKKEAGPKIEKLLEDLERHQKAGDKFNTKKFRLFWAREAYRCGNLDGALTEWIALGKEGSPEAQFILTLFKQWSSLSDDGSRAGKYAMRLFRPGGGTAKQCNGAKPKKK